MVEDRRSKRRVLFICGCIEPGKDGVGDYTRRLATELVNQNCIVAIAAVNDRFAGSSPIESHVDTIQIARLHSKKSTKIKQAFLKQTISNFSPDWISLQYVPYAYQSQGVPLKFALALAKMRNIAYWHIMFHEVHLGGVLSVKNHLIKYGQIKTIKKLTQLLKPLVVHTSNRAYRDMLRNLHVESKLLGLFGNIPIISQASINTTVNDQKVNAVYFGAPPKDYDFHVFANAIKAFLSNSDLILKLDFLGRKSPLRERFAQYLIDSCGAGQLQIQDKGEKSPDQLSQLFSTADFAIARVKPSLLGKSGAAITLLEHGLKLWVPMAENQSEISAHFEYRTDQCFAKLDELLASTLTFTAESRAKDVARKLLKDFDVAVDNS